MIARSEEPVAGGPRDEMLVGSLPVFSQDASARSAHTDRLRTSAEAAANTPQAVQQVVDHALAIRPDSRYRRAGDLSPALGEALAKNRDGQALNLERRNETTPDVKRVRLTIGGRFGVSPPGG